MVDERRIAGPAMAAGARICPATLPPAKVFCAKPSDVPGGPFGNPHSRPRSWKHGSAARSAACTRAMEGLSSSSDASATARASSPVFLRSDMARGQLLKSSPPPVFPSRGLKSPLLFFNKPSSRSGQKYANRLYLGEFLKRNAPLAEAPGASAPGRSFRAYSTRRNRRVAPPHSRHLLAPGGQLVTITANWHCRPWT